MTTVMIFGTFDIVHPGHLNLFRQARTWGDKLLIVVARDSNVLKFKGKKPRHTEQERLTHLQKITLAQVILGEEKDIYHVVEVHKPDILCFGYDQRANLEDVGNELMRRGISAKLIRLSPYKPKQYKSGKL